MLEQSQELGLKVCDEAPVDLIINGKKLVTFMCTPENLDMLAVGYLYTRGLIESYDEIGIFGVCEDIRKIIGTVDALSDKETYSLAGVLTSGCGGNGTVVSEDFFRRKEIQSNFRISMGQLKKLALQMFSQAIKYKETGGIHCAALAHEEGLIMLQEDIGRHNAVDKVIGYGLMENVDFSNTMIITTGRISSDMILKAVAGGIPVVASRSIPSSLALEIAERVGVTVVGRIGTREPAVYSHTHRIQEESHLKVLPFG